MSHTEFIFTSLVAGRSETDIAFNLMAKELPIVLIADRMRLEVEMVTKNNSNIANEIFIVESE
jgi:hypothetical protein